MKYSNLSFADFKILEWYDGIVRAIGMSRENDYLLVLVAWEMVKDEKLYLAVKLDQVSKEKIISELNSDRSIEENWQAFNSVYDQFIKNYDDKVYLIRGELIKDKKFELKLIESEHLGKTMRYDFNHTTDKATIEFWFDLYI